MQNLNINRALKLFVTFGGLGLSPKAPGTLGSFGALFLVYVFSHLPYGQYVHFGFAIVFMALSLWLTAIYLNTQAQNKDPSEVVVDEVMGILISFFLVPITPITLVAGFVMFRFLDIVKPFPISFFDRKVPGAAGVMLDDVVAGIIVNMIFHFLIIPYGWL